MVLESLARRRLEWACAACARGEIDLSSVARYAGVSIYEMMDELRRRGIEMLSVEQFLDGLENLADLFELPELREECVFVAWDYLIAASRERRRGLLLAPALPSCLF